MTTLIIMKKIISGNKKKGKKTMRDNLDDEQKQLLKIEDNKRKKAKFDNFNVDEKEQMRIY